MKTIFEKLLGAREAARNLLQNDFRIVTAEGHGDGGAENQRSAQPCVGAEMLPQQLNAEDGAEYRLDIEKDAGAGGGDVMDSPVPEQRSEGCAGDSADGE